MLPWLARNAAAVQAIAAVSNVLVALALAGLTAWYVRLTSDIARSSLQQVEHLKDASTVYRRQNALSEAALARRLRVPLMDLQQVGPHYGQLRSYSHLSAGDINDLEALARPVSDDAIALASKAAFSLRVILGFIEKNRKIDERQGWIPTAADLKDWQGAVETAPVMLEQLESLCRQAAV